MANLSEDSYEAISAVCTATTANDALLNYIANSKYLGEITFVLSFDSTGNVISHAARRDFTSGAALRTLFASDHLIVINNNIVDSMLHTGKVEIPVDYSVSLDTMAVSYIEPYLNDSFTRLPADFAEIFDFLASNNVQVDPVPYLLENIGNLDEKHKQERIFEKLKCYGFLQSLTSENHFKHGISEFKTDSSKFDAFANFIG